MWSSSRNVRKSTHYMNENGGKRIKAQQHHRGRSLEWLVAEQPLLSSKKENRRQHTAHTADPDIQKSRPRPTPVNGPQHQHTNHTPGDIHTWKYKRVLRNAKTAKRARGGR